MSNSKKPSLGVYIKANGKVYSKPKEVMDMLKWVVNIAEKEKKVLKICQTLQFSAAEMTPRKSQIQDFNQESIDKIELLINHFKNQQVGYYSEELKNILITIYKEVKNNHVDSFYSFLEMCISKELFCYRGLNEKIII